MCMPQTVSLVSSEPFLGVLLLCSLDRFQAQPVFCTQVTLKRGVMQKVLQDYTSIP